MGRIHDNRITELTHLWNTTKIDYQIGIAESCASFGQHDLIVSRIGYLLGGKSHGFRREELSLLDVYDLTSACGSYEQVCLTAKERRYLQDIDIGRGRFGLMCFVNVCHGRNLESFAYFAKNPKGFLVANTGE